MPRPLERDVEAFEIAKAEARVPACGDDAPRPHGSNARNAQQKLERGVHDLNGKAVHVLERPGELWVEVKIEPRLLWRRELVWRKA